MLKRKTPFDDPEGKKLKCPESLMKVYCRIRPIRVPQEIYKTANNTTLDICTPPGSSVSGIENFQFSSVFSESATQCDVFSAVCLPVLRELVTGKSALVFAYGITNAGKTHTILGSSEDLGIIPRALSFLTRSAEQCNVSFYEIYNDKVFDLLVAHRQSLKIRQGAAAVSILGLTQASVRSELEGLELLRKGLKNRKTAETSLNSVSSRSHSVFSIALALSKIVFVDLAGAERTDRTKTEGERLREAGHINNSLTVLSRCLETLKNNQAKGKRDLVPYRDSTLTKIFSEYFAPGPATNLALIVNINPSRTDFEETLNALKFAAISTGLKPVKSRLEPLKRPSADKVALLESLIKQKDEELSKLKLECPPSGLVQEVCSLVAKFQETNIKNIALLIQNYEKALEPSHLELVSYPTLSLRPLPKADTATQTRPRPHHRPYTVKSPIASRTRKRTNN